MAAQERKGARYSPHPGATKRQDESAHYQTRSHDRMSPVQGPQHPAEEEAERQHEAEDWKY
jgi:hypothetical protein